MGVLYSVAEVSSGSVPKADGTDHLKALNFFFDRLTDPDAPTANNIRLLMLGSVVTGQANRRSDLDKFLITGDPLESNPDRDLFLAGRQQIYIRSVEQATAKRYKVHIEGKTFTEREIGWFGRNIGEPNWASHCVDIQDRFPHYAYRRPFDDFDSAFRNSDGSIGYVEVPGLRRYSIGLDNLDNTDTRNNLLSNVMSYFEGKVELFSNAGDFNHKRHTDMHRYQRALEIAKAATRKALAISALEGQYDGSGDVTSKSSMYEQVAELTKRIDGNGRIQNAIDLVIGLDNEYSAALDEALETGNTSKYLSWLQQNYLPSCAAALFISRSFYNYANDFSWTDSRVVLDMFNNDYSESFEDSASEDMELLDTPDIEPALPYLVNLTANQVYDLAMESVVKESDGAEVRELALVS